ncbi:MAG TPA: protein kinase [Ktedonobacteraceae bacterium]
MLLDEQNNVILSDFGIAVVDHSTSSTTEESLRGTAPYMAPEQIQAQAHIASDQYSLAIVVYEWLSGERPFTGSALEILAKHLIAAPPPLSTKVRGLRFL